MMLKINLKLENAKKILGYLYLLAKHKNESKSKRKKLDLSLHINLGQDKIFDFLFPKS